MLAQLYVMYLVVCPVGPELPGDLCPCHTDCMAALKSLAEATELIGPSETWQDNFQAELVYVRMYWQESRDNQLPSVYDCERWPTEELARAAIEFNLAVSRQLEANRPLDTERGIINLQRQTQLERTREAWQFVVQVRSTCQTCQTWIYRRRALAALRKAIGDKAYYSSELPEAVPLAWFRPLD